MIVLCDKCGHENKIKNFEAFRGMKNVVFTCKNKVCKQKVKFYLPAKEKSQEEKRDITIAITSKVRIDNAFLLFKTNQGEDKHYKIQEGVNNVGRKASGFEQEIAIETDDRHMSRMHAVIINKESNGSRMCILRDYNSKNKVKLNGKVLSSDEEIYLMEGDEILLGTTKVKYKINYKSED